MQRQYLKLRLLARNVIDHRDRESETDGQLGTSHWRQCVQWGLLFLLRHHLEVLA